MPSAKGGKKKANTDAAAAAAAAAPAAEPATPIEVVETKKKAAKKPVKVVAVVTPNGIEGSFQAEPRRPLIVHLGIRTNDIVFHDQTPRYDPNPPVDKEPEPYDESVSNFFTGGQEVLEGSQAAAATAAPATSTVNDVVHTPVAEKPSEEYKSMPCFTKTNLMVQFKEAREAKTLPEKTEVACFWCAHTFQHMPCIIPEREVNGVYNVYGNFCSPECGVAYLLKEGIDPHVRWERMALLHRIYDREGRGQIFPAPVRESLALFGGPMSIDVFRATVRQKKVRVDLHMPPMVSILGSIDTKPIDFFDTISKQGNTGGAILPQRSVEEGLRLKRSKPLKDRESTLDTVMNIKVGAGARRPAAHAAL